jgi:tetratricopeptide (TPR) repeat protein
MSQTTISNVEKTLRSAGWIGVFDACKASEPAAAADLAFQYLNPTTNVVIQLEFHRKGLEFHLRVTELDQQSVYLLFRVLTRSVRKFLAALLAAQSQLATDTLEAHLPSLVKRCRSAFVIEGDDRHPLGPGPKALRAAQLFRDAAAATKRGDPSSALDRLERAVHIEPALAKNARLLLLQSMALQGVGRGDEALGVIDAALALDEDDAALHFQRARLLTRQSHNDDWLKAMRVALTIEPGLAFRIPSDQTFETVREWPDFVRLVSSIRDRAASAK